MTNQELLQYRTKLIRDAANMNHPERTPIVSFFVTWKILDAGYKLSEALNNYDVMEKVLRHHQEEYNFDMLNDLGIRNPYRFSQAMSSPTYVVDDEKESLAVNDIHVAEPSQVREIAANYMKFMFEKGMPAKYDWWGAETDLAKVQGALMEMFGFMGFSGKINKIMATEYGLPPRVAPNPLPQISLENVLGFIFGIKGTSVLMRRDKEGLHQLLNTMNAMFYAPAIAGLQKCPEGQNPAFCYDSLLAMLAHNFLSPAQFEEFYLPELKPYLDTIQDKKMNILVFTEGNILRFKDYFKDYNKGVITLLPENDDIFEMHKELPNVALMGGMPCALLGHATKEECIARAKKVVDEIGKDGGLLFSQDKMGSYRNDATSENLKAVNDFVREYRG